MNATDIILRARSVSDLPNSQFLSHLDELNSLNEAWKDIYAALIDNDDDYYVTEITFTLNATFAVAGAANEYLYPLPADFLKLRYLDFRGDSNNYLPCRKFNLSKKDDQPGDPYYRIKGSNLWIVGGAVPATGITMRMGYYPVQSTVTAPQTDLVYGTSYAPNLFTAVVAPAYAPYLETMVYANGNVITSENITNATVSSPVALFTESGAVSNIVYYKGIIYYIRGGLIWYKATALTAAFVAPTQATTPTGVVSFYISGATIYYSTATQIRSCDLTGGTDTLVNATANVTSLAVIGSTVIYRTSASLVGTLAPVTTMYASGIAKVTSDGGSSPLLYILDNSNNVRRVTFNATTAAIVTDDVVDTNVTDIGQVVYDINQNPATWIIPELKATGPFQQLLGHDGTINYNFSYPNNLAPEIMAWRSAVDYRTKQGSDPTAHLLRLGHPTTASEGAATGLWSRFEQSIRRDDYQPELIRNVYRDRSWIR